MLNNELFVVLLQVKEVTHGQKAATYTLCGGDVHVAADEGQTVVHAHLKINHPETNQQGLGKSLCSLGSTCLTRMMPFELTPNHVSRCRSWQNL